MQYSNVNIQNGNLHNWGWCIAFEHTALSTFYLFSKQCYISLFVIYVNTTLPAKARIANAMVFPVVMYRCESWTIKKAECRRIDPFKLWCWRRLLKVPSTARRSNQSILKEINTEYSLERLMLKPQYFGPLMRSANSLQKTLIWGKIEAKMEKGAAEDEMVA